MSGNTVQIKGTFDDQVSGPVDKLRDKFDQLGKSQGAKSILQGVGIGAGIRAFNLLDSAIGAVGDALGETVKKAEEDQVASARLDASLKANVANWDGNRDAINGFIDSQTNLGFTNDETTASMAKLVAATGDVRKAQDILTTSEDLARLKGISLAEATDALTKVEGGSYRILKSLGIELPKNATQVQALAAVQKIAAGQAAAFASTTAGGFDVMNAKVEEAQARIGRGFLPIVQAATIQVGNLFDAIDGGTRDTVQGLEQEVRNFQILGGTANELGDTMTRLQAEKAALLASPFTTQSEMDSINRSIDALDALQRTTRGLGKDIDDVLGPGGDVPEAFDYAALRSKVMAASIHHNLTSAHDATVLDAKALADAMIKPIAGKERMKEIEDALTGKSSLGKQLVKGLKSSDPLVKEAARKLQKDLQDELRGLAIEYSVNFSTEKKGDTPHHAGGGFAPYGQAFIGNEQGPELFTPAAGGFNVTPAGQTRNILTRRPSMGGGASGGGSPMAIPIAVPSHWSPGEQQKWARDALKALLPEMKRMGLL